MWHLAIPLAWPVITIAILLRTVECSESLRHPLRPHHRRPRHQHQVFSSIDYLTTIQFFDFGKGSAMGIVFLILVSAVITLFFRQMRKTPSLRGAARNDQRPLGSRRFWSRVARLRPAVAAAVFTIVPFLWAAVNSIKTLTETFQPGAIIPFLHFQPTLESWREVLIRSPDRERLHQQLRRQRRHDGLRARPRRACGL